MEYVVDLVVCSWDAMRDMLPCECQERGHAQCITCLVIRSDSAQEMWTVSELAMGTYDNQAAADELRVAESDESLTDESS